MSGFGSYRPAYSRCRATRAVASRKNWCRRVCLRMYRKTPVGAAREREGDELLDAWSWRFLATCRKSRWSHVTITKTSANGMPTRTARSEEHTSELQSLMRNSYAVFCLKKKQLTHKRRTKVYNKSH